VVVVTACGADRAAALADLTGGPGSPAATAGVGRLVVLADRAAGSIPAGKPPGGRARRGGQAGAPAGTRP
jgi:hypothetical protein